MANGDQHRQRSTLMAGTYWLSAQRFGTREDFFESAQPRAFRDFSRAAVVAAVGVTKVRSATTPSPFYAVIFLGPCLQELYHGFWSERDTKRLAGSSWVPNQSGAMVNV